METIQYTLITSTAEKRKNPFDNMDTSNDTTVAPGANEHYKRNRAGSYEQGFHAQNDQGPSTSMGVSSSTSSNQARQIMQQASIASMEKNIDKITRQNDLQKQKIDLITRLSSLGPNQEQEKSNIQQKINEIDNALRVMASGFA